MKNFVFAMLCSVLSSVAGLAQGSFEITGTPIPQNLLQLNYGGIPKGINAYDLSICNVTETKQSLVSSKVYQALSQSNSSVEPIGRQIMLAAILRNQNRSAMSILGMMLNSSMGVLPVLTGSKYRVPSGLMAGAALGLLAGQQVINSLKPILSADQLEKFESQVLEPALVLDSGSCVERTVFVSSATPKTTASSRVNAQPLSFHVR
jgi:hypothetical protein